MNRIARLAIYNKFERHCAYCGEKITYEEMQVDHVIPKRNFVHSIRNDKNGQEAKFIKVPTFLKHLNEDDVNHNDNLFPACRSCNNRKSTLSLESFRSEIAKQIDRLNKYSTAYRLAKRYNLLKEQIKPIIFYFETLTPTSKGE